MAKTKKVKSTGRFRAGFGKTVKERLKAIEEKQKKRQKCPYCKKSGLKAESKGIWYCKNCNKKFAGRLYFIELK